MFRRKIISTFSVSTDTDRCYIEITYTYRHVIKVRYNSNKRELNSIVYETKSCLSWCLVSIHTFVQYVLKKIKNNEFPNSANQRDDDGMGPIRFTWTITSRSTSLLLVVNHVQRSKVFFSSVGIWMLRSRQWKRRFVTYGIYSVT